MVDEGDDTQAFQAIEQREEVAAAEPPPPGPPARMMFEDIWPWLALLGLVVVAGLLVWLFVLRDNGSKQTVPAVVGLRQQAAIERLNKDGYDVRAIIQPAKRPRGIVDSQTPGGGSQLPKGSSVTIHVSNGQTPTSGVTTTQTQTTQTKAATTTGSTTVDTAPSSQIPDVVGQDAQSGAGQVEAAGFVADSAPAEGANGTPGSVVSEDPAGGSQARAGIAVTLGVVVPASRPAVQIPDVTGLSGSAARAKLLGSKLTVRTAYRSGKPGVVLAQSATGNAPAYTQITITVGQ
jgi:beta-lactam-binding protein with PASTA domain